MNFRPRPRMRTARLLHVCFECLTCIQPGTEYCYLPVIQNVAWKDYKFCLRCSTLRNDVLHWKLGMALRLVWWDSFGKDFKPGPRPKDVGEELPIGELMHELREALNDGFKWPVPLAMPEQVASRLVSNQEI